MRLQFVTIGQNLNWPSLARKKIRREFMTLALARVINKIIIHATELIIRSASQVTEVKCNRQTVSGAESDFNFFSGKFCSNLKVLDVVCSNCLILWNSAAHDNCSETEHDVWMLKSDTLLIRMVAWLNDFRLQIHTSVTCIFL